MGFQCKTELNLNMYIQYRCDYVQRKTNGGQQQSVFVLKNVITTSFRSSSFFYPSLLSLSKECFPRLSFHPP